MRKLAISLGICALVGALLSARAQAQAGPEPESLPLLRAARPGCLQMARSFCAELHSPSNQGHLTLRVGAAPIEIRRGRTDNDFPEAYFAYRQTQLRYHEQLPEDFRASLLSRGYVDKLEALLGRKALRGMHLQERIESTRLTHELEAEWNSALEEAVILRTEARHPGYARLPEALVPMELSFEAQRVERTLRAEIARALWAQHPNWRRVEAQFEEVRSAYLERVRSHPGLDDRTRADWLQRLAETRLVIPGSDPTMPMRDCGTTAENAFYYPDRNYLTVCAGDFNAEDMRLTIAHELGHALDVRRSLTLHEQRSRLGEELTRLRAGVCEAKAPACGAWSAFLGQLPEALSELGPFRPQLPAFQRCLKGKATRTPKEAYLRRVAREEVQENLSRLAERSVFLRTISPELPMPDGERARNPMYLNPCGYFLWEQSLDPFDEDLQLLLFFTAAYQCGDEEPGQRRFQRALQTAREVQTRLTYARLRMEGEFSDSERLQRDGYAASPTERFADALAGEVFARMLQEEPDVGRRRAAYLSNTAWLCRGPSIQDLHPEEARAERELSLDAHSELGRRQREFLSGPIREALQCAPDFPLEQRCHL